MPGLGLVVGLPLLLVAAGMGIGAACYISLAPRSDDMRADRPRSQRRTSARNHMPNQNAASEVQLASTVVELALDEVNDVREDVRGQSVLALGLLALDGAVAFGILAAAAAKAAAPPPYGHWPHGWWWPMIPVALSAVTCGAVLARGGSRSLSLHQLYRASRSHLPNATEGLLEIASALIALANTTVLTRVRLRARLIQLAAALLTIAVVVGVVRFWTVFQ